MMNKEAFEHIERENIGAGLITDEEYRMEVNGVTISIFTPADGHSWCLSIVGNGICEKLGYGDSKSSRLRYWEDLPSFESASQIVEDALKILA